MDLRVMAMNEYSIFPKASGHLLEVGSLTSQQRCSWCILHLQLTKNYIKLCDIVSYIVYNGWFLGSMACQLSWVI